MTPLLSVSGLHRLHHLPFTLSSFGKYKHSRIRSTPHCIQMDGNIYARKANLRVGETTGHIIELMELHSAHPNIHILFIPGNPGIIAFYKDYVESLFRFFNGKASITAISHTGHTAKDWEAGNLFSLEEQIDHKVQFIERGLSNLNVPLILVGHSIGAYIALHVFKMLPDKVQYVVGLYPFLTINTSSSYQALIRWCASIWILREILSRFAGFVGWLPQWSPKILFKGFIGREWSPNSINVAIRYLLQYSMVRNFSYMGMTEFRELQEDLDWSFIRERQNQMSLLFGIDDHWGPLSLFEQVSLEAPDLHIAIEKEGHSHAFCCTEAGSDWVAGYTANTISSHVLITSVS